MMSIDNMNIKGIKKIYELDKSFSWNKARYINSVNYDIVQDEHYNSYSVLQLGLIFSINNKSYEITIRFEYVVNFSLNKIGGEYNQILGFEIIDKSKDGWEDNQRFFINDYEDGIICFSCKDIEVISVIEGDVMTIKKRLFVD